MQNNKEFYQLLKEKLFTAVIGDVLDGFGYTNQFLPPQITPIKDDMIVAGRAMPVLSADVDEAAEKTTAENEKPFGLMLEALDDLKPNEIYICTGSSPNYALWGEIMSVRAQKLGAAGAILDGYVRDTRGIIALNFPTFGIGKYAQDQRPRGSILDFRVPIKIKNVTIEPGDLLFGDLEGVLVIPQAVESEVIKLALEKVSTEQIVKQEIGVNGMSSAEAFQTFGVL